MADSLIFQGLQHFRLPWPSLSPGTCSDSCSVSQWCYLSISSFATPSPFAFNLSQHQGLFQWDSSLHQVARVLQLQLQHQSFQWKFKADSLGLISLNSLQSKGLSKVFSNTTVQKHQFLGAQPSLRSNSYMTTGKTIDWTIWTLVGKVMSFEFLVEVCHSFSSKK